MCAKRFFCEYRNDFKKRLLKSVRCVNNEKKSGHLTLAKDCAIFALAFVCDVYKNMRDLHCKINFGLNIAANKSYISYTDIVLAIVSELFVVYSVRFE